MNTRILNITTIFVGIILLAAATGYNFRPSPRFLPTPEWTAMAFFPSAMLGGVLGLVLVWLVNVRNKLGLNAQKKGLGLSVSIFVVTLCGYFTGHAVVAHGAQALTGQERTSLVVNSHIDASYRSSRRSEKGWRLAYGQRLPMPLEYVRTCIGRGSPVALVGQGSRFGLYIDKMTITDRTHGDKVVINFAEGTGHFPDRCAEG